MERPHRHPGGREGGRREAVRPGGLQGPFRTALGARRGWGRRWGASPAADPSRRDRRVSDLSPPPSEGTAAPRGRRDVAPGRRKGAASAGSRAQRPSPSTRHPRPPARGAAPRGRRGLSRRPPPTAARLPSGARPRGPARGSRLLAGPAARPTPVRHATHWAGRRPTSPLIGASGARHPAARLSRAAQLAPRVSARRTAPRGLRGQPT